MDATDATATNGVVKCPPSSINVNCMVCDRSFNNDSVHAGVNASGHASVTAGLYPASTDSSLPADES